MSLTKETYEKYDIAKKVIPSLEIRFIDNKCHVYIEGTSRYWCSGPSDYINDTMKAICTGIQMAGMFVPSLKKILKNL